MATEIELKAWVDDPEALEARLSRLAELSGSFEKEDLYWFPAGEQGPALLSSRGIRVRRLLWKSGGAGESAAARDRPLTSTLVTCKSKPNAPAEAREKIEVNEELEFGVSDGQAFGEFLRRLGFAPVIAKTKRGRTWRQGDLTAELSLVGGLGWFIEVEILAGDDSPETVEKTRARLLCFLEKTGIKADRIEPRYYAELLAEGKFAPADPRPGS